MFKIRKLVILICLMSVSSISVAGVCGGGKVIKIIEGGYSSDDYLVKLDNSRTESIYQNSHPGTEFGGLYFRFKKSTLSPERFKGIKAMAMMAYAMKNDVYISSQSGSCDDVSEIGLIE